MSFKAKARKTYIEVLKKNPLFFMKMSSIPFYDGNFNEIYELVSFDNEISITLKNPETITDILLLVIDIDTINSDDEQSEFCCHIVNSEDDLVILLNSIIIRSQNSNDRYSFRFLLWFLNHCNWTVEQLKDALNKYNIEVQFYICKWLVKICHCLSYRRQEKIKSVLSQFNYNYDIYMPKVVIEALNYVNPQISVIDSDLNLFDLIDYLFKDNISSKIINNENNQLIDLCKWLSTENPLKDYSFLRSIYHLLSYQQQMIIIKRYFHDIRLGYTKLDLNLIQQFKDGDFEIFSRFRNAIYATDIINISNILLCDSILTIAETKGNVIQSFNGVLDSTIKYCDIIYPKVDIGLDNLLPTCNGGAVFNNEAFRGFIEYCILYKLDEDKLTDKNLMKYIISYLNNLNPDNSLNKWKIQRERLDCRIKNFINYELEENLYEIEINYNDISLDKFRNYINANISKFTEFGSQEQIINRDNIEENDSEWLLDFLIPYKVRIFPVTSYIGSNYEKEIINLTQLYKRYAKIEDRIIEVLKIDLGEDCIVNNKYVEIKYDKKLLDKILRLYYYKDLGDTKLSNENMNYLKTKNIKRGFPIICVPTISEVNNHVLNLPFFWCRGQECFMNNLYNQTLQNCSDWVNYTLFHILEIMGYSKISIINNCYVPDVVISRFVVIASRAMKKFNRLKCRICGHLMFSTIDGNFNRYNFYSCVNPICSEYAKNIYLNYCYKCKKGLIDSRDNMKCPNGWYICSECLSCCDDEQYERLVQRYVLSNKPIPISLQHGIGQGHNDKGKFFCPYCGFEILFIYDKTYYCNNCKMNLNMNK